MRNHGKKLPRGNEAGRSWCIHQGQGMGWLSVLAGGRGTRGSRRGRRGRIGRDSQAVVLRSSPGTPLVDLKQWRDL